MVKIVKTLAIVTYVLTCLVIVVMEIWLYKHGTNIFLSVSLLYWLVFVSWLVTVVSFKWKAAVSLRVGFALFVFGAFFAIISMGVNAEVLMRVGFIAFLVGMVQALVEHKKNEN